jgi:dihydrofolate synthase/folylpolyglutamate synthase
MSARYRELLERLLPARRFGVVLGLDRMRALLDRLESPDRRLGTVVHVGGTNGKGSTVAMIAALAAESGARVATYTSPHLSCLRERIAIDGAMIDEAAFIDAADRVRAAGGDALTFFEQVTAIAMLAIAEARVDVTVLEVGLGGRLDATNVVDAPVAVVTGVALDHQAILGDTLELIAREKAGIFKRGQRAVVGASGEPAAQEALVAAARAAGVAALSVVDGGRVRKPPGTAHVDAGMDGDATRIDPADLTRVDPEDVPAVALIGEHQERNAAAALAAIDHLQALGVLRLDRGARARALARVRHPGRFELVAGVPPIILDAAHNPHGARALAATLRARGERPLLVLAVSADKDVAEIVRALRDTVGGVIATRYQQERALAADELARVVASAAPKLAVETAPSLAAALERGRVRATARGRTRPILIAGSLFIVGEARVLLCGALADPMWAGDPAP